MNTVMRVADDARALALTVGGRGLNERAVRTVGAAMSLVMICLGLAAVRPATVNACVGRYLDFQDALYLSDGAIYAGRVTRAETTDRFWKDLTIDIDRVVRGPASERVRRAQAGHVCDGIRVGQYGYIVRDVLDPEHGPDKQDLFFRVSRSDARRALLAAGLPDTGTAPPNGPNRTVPAPAMPWAWLLGWYAATVAILCCLRCRRGSKTTA